MVFYNIEKINKNIINKNFQLKMNKDDILEILNSEGFKVNYINFQNNSINGMLEREKSKYFFKIVNKEEYLNEINGYFKIKTFFPVNKIVEIYKFDNAYIIIFEYENSIGKNKGLLNDFFVQNDKIIKEDVRRRIKCIINIYKKTFRRNTLKDSYPMEKFFQDRINSRLRKWYNDDYLLDYSVIINGQESCITRKIIKETINYFEKKRLLQCAMTQGDPNTLNIGLKPIFFDFSTSGYNPIICEFAVAFYSALIADAYFNPKYHTASYYNHEKALENILSFSPNLMYIVDENRKNIEINSNIKTSKIRIDFIKEYIEMLVKLNIKIGKEIIYYMVMRILCVLNIRKMSREDYFYSLFILHYLYQNVMKDDSFTLITLYDLLNDLDFCE